MLKCPNCGEENDFGKVFCMGCGTKLDLTQVKEEDIEDMGREGVWLSYWPVYVGVLVVLILAVIGMAMWPVAGEFGEAGTRGEAGAVKGQLSVMKRLGSRQVVQPQFREKQLNSYLQNYTIKKLALAAFAVDVSDDLLKVRITKQYGPYGGEGWKKHVALEMQVNYAVDGLNLVPKGGAIGHLPLPGPLCQLPHNMISSIVKGAEEWKSMQYLKEISIEEGRVKLRASK